MNIGYARVSTDEQHTENQIEQLAKAGCDPKHIYKETASGGTWDRPQLHKALDHLRDGDVLVVWKLDRLSRSLKDLLFIVEKIRDAKATFTSLTEHLDTKGPGGTALMQMLGVFAEFERNIIAERTKLGVRQAMADGKIVGRPAKLDASQKKEVIRLLKAGQSTQAQIARTANVDRSVISRLVSKIRVEEAAKA